MTLSVFFYLFEKREIIQKCKEKCANAKNVSFTKRTR